ncbi:hypothetical protein [Fimbriiglobus ruber]|uniref:Uncharacterized protein n=1 Tax=Fimbriiglobus ruber TaxID=1908690 RepID=A0A225DSX3_9BACT|nr:hypothetical protein [Fimbriiglobus ruber]OWK39475.1 hypothetical protein FRUB_06038 [Fimbriiglobus ruber]
MTDPNPKSTEHIPQDPVVENALLRAALWLATKSLKRYHDAKHTKVEAEIDGSPRFQVIVTEEARQKAADAIARAEGMLQGKGRGL